MFLCVCFIDSMVCYLCVCFSDSVVCFYVYVSVIPWYVIYVYVSDWTTATICSISAAAVLIAAVFACR